MKLRIRNLDNVEVEVGAKLEDLVLDVKRKAGKLLELASDDCILIHKGRILKNNEKIQSSDAIRDNDILVLAIPHNCSSKSLASLNKQEGTPRNPCSTAPYGPDILSMNMPDKGALDSRADEHEAGQEGSSFPKPKVGSATKMGESTDGSEPITNSEQIRNAGFEAHGKPQGSTAVQTLCEMGFDRFLAETALQHVGNSLTGAIEFLVSRETVSSPGSLEASVGKGRSEGTAAKREKSPGGLNDIFSSFRRHPQFQEIKRQTQVNPDKLPGMLLMLMNPGNPQLAELIINNQVEFLKLITEEDIFLENKIECNEETIMPLTVEQLQCVTTLQGLGFPRSWCIKSLIAHDWNTENAADYLLGVHWNEGDVEDND